MLRELSVVVTDAQGKELARTLSPCQGCGKTLSSKQRHVFVLDKRAASGLEQFRTKGEFSLHSVADRPLEVAVGRLK